LWVFAIAVFIAAAFAHGAAATKPVPQGPVSGPEMELIGISARPGAVSGPPPAGPGTVPWDTRNTDLAFWGDRVIQGRYDGFRVIDVKNKRAPVELAWFQCVSPQGDVGVYGNLVFRSVDGPQQTNGCTTTSQNGNPAAADCSPAPAPCTGFEGIQIFDISDLGNIRLVASVALDCGSHTHTVVPEPAKNRVLIYNQVSGNGRQSNPGKYGNQCLRNLPTDPEFNKADIVSVPLDDPAAASLLNQYDLGVHEGTPTEVCHDFGVILGAVNMGACAGHMVAIFDLSDPAAPVFMHGSMPSPEVSIFHSAVWTWDGSKVISGWEPGGGTAPRCQPVGTVFPGNQGVQTVDMRTAWIHDAMTGDVVGKYFMPRSQSQYENCTVHNINTAPADKRYSLIHGSYQSGTAWVDFTDLANVYEVAWMDPPPLDPPDPPNHNGGRTNFRGGDWSSYFYNGYVYESDTRRGLYIWKVDAPETRGRFANLEYLNPQTNHVSVPYDMDMTSEQAAARSAVIAAGAPAAVRQQVLGKLDEAAKKWNNDNVEPACERLDEIVDIVDQREAAGRIGEAQAMALLDAYDALAEAMMCASSAPWPAQARRVKITRDDWGVPHVVGKTDAQAVFGMIYAQAEDDFNRVERNYLVSLGRLAEAEGEGAIWQDLRQRLYLPHEQLKELYASSPAWLQKLMNAWADGLNYFLATHPEVKPRAITRFEPWMALSFTEGSIGGDIERISLNNLRNFYDVPPPAPLAFAAEPEALPEPEPETEPNGSNGIAIAPSHTKNGKALLLINPHTSHYFRHVQQVRSHEGLEAYGAITWGQFFIYQGFNRNVGWMHTSAPVDNVDEFLETITTEADGSRTYRYGTEQRPVATRPVTISYRAADGTQTQRTFVTYHTHHGPIVRQTGGRWVATGMLNNPIAALEQSYLRTKARDYDEYIEVANRKANSSNSTLFADSKGNIAFLLPQFMPIRNDSFTYTQAVDGSDPATDWQGLHSLDTIPHVVNPQSGWAYNTNNWPWTCCGGDSPSSTAYPRYMNTGGENDRGRNAIRLLSARNDFTLETLRDTAFDSYLITFATLLPPLVAAWDALPDGDAQKVRLAEPIAVLRNWDYRSGVASIETSLAVFWAAGPRNTNAQRLSSLDAAVTRLTQDFGSWRVPWGEVNRFQRNDGAITQVFDDAKPSVPVSFASGNFGSLASYPSSRRPGTVRFYATSGNTFVAAIEFGPKLRALALREGGNSGNPASPHFFDQAERFASGDLGPVYFEPGELEGHIERSYRPGQ
jgi:acyl-homoserine-lactone acylase